MSAVLPDGAIVSIASTYGSAKTVTAITNANPGVVTSTTHGLTDGNIIEVTSGWSKLDKRIARVDNSATDSFDLEGIDTTSTTNYPAGAGVGSVRQISAWTEIAQIINSSSSGGDQNFVDFGYLSELDNRQLPGSRSPQSISFDIADDDTLAHWAILAAADEDRLVRAIRIQLVTGAVIYHNAIITFNQNPTLTKGQVMAVKATLSLQARLTRYSS